MMEFGETLRAAREAKGLSCSEVAEATNMVKSVVEDLENENFSRIVAPIYGRGFVKLYCEAVGIDSAPMIECFMDIYNGKHDLKIKERPVKVREPEAITADEPPVMEETRPGAIPGGAVATNRSSLQDDLFSAGTRTEPETAAGDSGMPEHGNRAAYSRYSAPMRDIHSLSAPVNPRVWRLALLAAASLVVLFIAFSGIKALYKATSPEPSTHEEDRPVSPAPAQPRKPAEVPPLYIDRIQ